MGKYLIGQVLIPNWERFERRNKIHGHDFYNREDWDRFDKYVISQEDSMYGNSDDERIYVNGVRLDGSIVILEWVPFYSDMDVYNPYNIKELLKDLDILEEKLK